MLSGKYNVSCDILNGIPPRGCLKVGFLSFSRNILVIGTHIIRLSLRFFYMLYTVARATFSSLLHWTDPSLPWK